MSENAVSLPAVDTSSDDGRVYVLDLVTLLVERRWFLIICTAVCGALALAISFLMTPVFTSTAKILPPQQQQSGMASVLGQIGGLAGAAGSLGGLKSPNDLYMGMLESRTIADRLIARFKLQERYNVSTMDEARKELSSSSEISSGKKDGFIWVTVSDAEAKVAAEMANAYVDELTKLTQTLALTEASKKRVFFEKQLRDAAEQLAAAEITLRSTQERTGLIQPDAQLKAIIGNVAQLNGTIAAKEVQIASLRTYAKGENPELLRAEQELRSLKEQLSKSEHSNGGKNDELMVPVGKIPGVGVEFVRGTRSVKYYETIYELLAKQFELAKLEEAKESSLIQLLDAAIPAERKSKPKRVLMVLTGSIIGAVTSILYLLAMAGYTISRRDLASAARWTALATALRGKAKSSAI